MHLKYLQFLTYPLVRQCWQVTLIIFFHNRYPGKHPIDDCGFIQLMLYSWITPVFRKGFKKPLELHDLGKLPQTDSAAFNYRRLLKFWKEEVRGNGLENASIGKALFRAMRTRALAGGFMFLLSLLISFVGPVCIW